MRTEKTQLLDLISAAFPAGAAHPVLSLSQGDEIDSYDTPTPDVFPVDCRDVSEREMEEHHWGFTHFDAESWRFYLPAFWRILFGIVHAASHSWLQLASIIFDHQIEFRPDSARLRIANGRSWLVFWIPHRLP